MRNVTLSGIGYEDVLDYILKEVESDILDELLCMIIDGAEPVKDENIKLETEVLEMMNLLRENLSRGILSQDKIEESKKLLRKGEEYLEEIRPIKVKQFDKEYKELRRSFNNIRKKEVSRIDLKSLKLKQLKITENLNKALNKMYSMAKEEMARVDILGVIDIFREEISITEDLLEKMDNNKVINIFDCYDNINESEDDIPTEYKSPKDYKSLANLAVENGFYPHRQTGSHVIYKNKYNKIVVIPDKSGTVPIGTQFSILNRIFKD